MNNFNVHTNQFYAYLINTSGARKIIDMMKSPRLEYKGKPLDSRATRICAMIANGWMENREGTFHKQLKTLGFDPLGTLWRECIDLYSILEKLASDNDVRLTHFPKDTNSTLAYTYHYGPETVDVPVDVSQEIAFNFGSVTPVTLSKEDTMNQTNLTKAISTRIFVCGNDITAVSFDYFMSLLDVRNKQVTTLSDSAGSKTAAVKKQIASLKAEQKAIATLMDACYGSDEPTPVEDITIDDVENVVKTVVYVDNMVAADLSIDGFIDCIEKRNAAIKTLKDSAGAKTAAVKARIAKLEACASEITALLDEVHNTDEK